MAPRSASARKKVTRPEKPALKRARPPRPSSTEDGDAVISLRKTAYDEIKHRIITCMFKPGEYINELQLSAILKIGRTPVHQALDRLMLEGMVEVIPRKGVIVKPLTLNEVLQIIEIRLINESYCARLAAERADSSEIAELTDVLSRAKHWISMRDVEQMMLLDREFHSIVARAGKNEVLADLLLRLHERSLRFWFISLNEPSQFEGVQKEHQAILAAIKAHQPNEAEKAMRAHIESFRSNVTRFL